MIAFFKISPYIICKTQLLFLNLQICICKYVFPVILLFYRAYYTMFYGDF